MRVDIKATLASMRDALEGNEDLSIWEHPGARPRERWSISVAYHGSWSGETLDAALIRAVDGIAGAHVIMDGV